MPPKSGNAFAQQKEFQQQNQPETKPYEENVPNTPLTTMSMFIGPDISQVDNGTTELPSFGKQPSGLNYIKAKLTGKSKKNKDSESSSSSSTKPEPSEYLSIAPDATSMPNIRRTDATPEVPTYTEREKHPTQPLPPHFSTIISRTVATPQSQCASVLKNDAMVLGNMSMSPTCSGSYAAPGYPAVVSSNHLSVTSMAGSILDASSGDSNGTVHHGILTDSSTQPSLHDTPYCAPLPPPAGDGLEEQLPFQQQLPFYLQMQPHERFDQTNYESQPFAPAQHGRFNSETWRQLHTQHLHMYWEGSDKQTGSVQSLHFSDEADELRKESLYNASASDTKSESDKAVLEALLDAEKAEVSFATPLGYPRRRSASDHKLRYSCYPADSHNTTLVVRKDDQPSAQTIESSRGLSPSAPAFRHTKTEISMSTVPTFLKPDRYEGDGPTQSEPAQVGLHNGHGAVASLQGAPTPFPDQKSAQGPDSGGNKGASVQSRGEGTTRGVYLPTAQRSHYGARRKLEEQMVHQFNVIHHHIEAAQHTLQRCVEEAKHFMVANSFQTDGNFMNQFRQLCIQNNGFRQYLERIQQQTTNLRQGITADVGSAVSCDLASRITAHEQRIREEFKRLNKNMLTLNENVYAIQRNVSKQMAQLNRKIDVLLEAARVETASGERIAPKTPDSTKKKLYQGLTTGQDELVDHAAMVDPENEGAITDGPTASAASSLVAQVSTLPPGNRKPTPPSTKQPIMVAALTSTPPHVPQIPPSLAQTPSAATITITNSNIPSPSAVSNARRIRHRQAREQGEEWKDNNRARLVAKGLVNAPSLQGRATNVHPALRYQDSNERLARGEDKQQTAEKEDDDNEVLWRRPSGDHEIGGRWYEAAIQQ